MNPVKSETWIIIELGACLMALALLSFFFTPSYEKTVWFVVNVFATALGTVMGYKFGRSMPQQSTDAKPGQSSQTDSRVITVPELPPATPAPSPTDPVPFAST
jgi:hypothetical protein